MSLTIQLKKVDYSALEAASVVHLRRLILANQRRWLSPPGHVLVVCPMNRTSWQIENLGRSFCRYQIC
jgi:hypothetical protein